MKLMQGFTIKGRQFEGATVADGEVVLLGESEVCEFFNNTMIPNPMHVRGLQFRVLSRGGRHRGFRAARHRAGAARREGPDCADLHRLPGTLSLPLSQYGARGQWHDALLRGAQGLGNSAGLGELRDRHGGPSCVYFPVTDST